MNPQHEKCGESLYTPKIYFRESGKLTTEKTGSWWCRKCKCYVRIKIGKQEDVEAKS